MTEAMDEEPKRVIARYAESAKADLAIRGAQQYGVAQGLMIAAQLAEKRGNGDLANELRDKARRNES